MFKDHFSGHAVEYAKYRPNYPEALFEYLARQARVRELAWDVATGSGQAALGLTKHFVKVHASDASKRQIENAEPHERIVYRVEPAEATSLEENSVDLITVAQALHWFDLERFYAEARRVMKERGILAAWTYGTCAIRNDVDKVIAWFYHEVVGPYWPEERRLVEQEYRTLPFPFTRLATPAFHMTAEWSLNEFVGYLGTWSATQRFGEAERCDYRALVRPKLERAWGDEQQKIRWPIHLLLGTCSAE
ncbi:MAG: class I SAM-dependent methyltransferase [Burkholderiales bacterium]